MRYGFVIVNQERKRQTRLICSQAVCTRGHLYSSSKRNIPSLSSRFYPPYHFPPHPSILYISTLYQLSYILFNHLQLSSFFFFFSASFLFSFFPPLLSHLRIAWSWLIHLKQRSSGATQVQRTASRAPVWRNGLCSII